MSNREKTEADMPSSEEIREIISAAYGPVINGLQDPRTPKALSNIVQQTSEMIGIVVPQVIEDGVLDTALVEIGDGVAEVMDRYVDFIVETSELSDTITKQISGLAGYGLQFAAKHPVKAANVIKAHSSLQESLTELKDAFRSAKQKQEEKELQDLINKFKNSGPNEDTE